jgi:hypothetical protein
MHLNVPGTDATPLAPKTSISFASASNK